MADTAKWTTHYEQQYPSLFVAIKSSLTPLASQPDPRYITIQYCERASGSNAKPVKREPNLWLHISQWKELRPQLYFLHKSCPAPYAFKRFGENIELNLLRVGLHSETDLATTIIVARKLWEPPVKKDSKDNLTTDSFSGATHKTKPIKFNCSAITLDSAAVDDLLRDIQLANLITATADSVVADNGNSANVCDPNQYM